MSKSILWLLLLLVWILLGLWLCNKYLCNCNTQAATHTAVAAVSNEPQAKRPNLGAWTFKDGDLSVSADQHLRYSLSNAAHATPLSGDLNGDLNTTATYLKAHPNRTINVTGYYRADEKNNSILPNLGLARANDIKNLLVTLGVPAAQISTDAKLLPDAAWFFNDTLYKGIDVAFNESPKNDTRLPDIKQRLLGKPITLYFETSKNEIDLSEQQRADFADLIYYLDHVPASSLDITGHTDNVGKRNANVTLSKERAAFATNYLSKNGNIGAQRMTSNGFGPDKPIAPNNTVEGRDKNRRVEVTLK